jgi:deazaflavin-dependent oxidoreductase (nitroreductase family)
MGLFLALQRLRGRPLLDLTTRGAKSGQLRTVPLRRLPDGPDAWLVVASFGGAAQHPAWYFNMAKNPDQVWITIGGRRVRVIPESLKGAERATAWQRIVAEAPGYGTYQEQTDREIPVVRLRAAPGER